jgi:hypothetical protein
LNPVYLVATPLSFLSNEAQAVHKSKEACTPKLDSEEPSGNDVEKLFLDIIPEIPTVIRQACQSLCYRAIAL